MLSVLVCGVTSPGCLSIRTSLHRRGNHFPSWLFHSMPPLSHSTSDLYHCLSPSAQTCTLAVTPSLPSFSESLLHCRAIWTSVRSATGCLQVLFVVVLFFLCLQNLSSVFQLNVQIVNNTAVTLLRSLHVCLEEQHSPKAFTKTSSPPTLGITVDLMKGKWFDPFNNLHPVIVGRLACRAGAARWRLLFFLKWL